MRSPSRPPVFPRRVGLYSVTALFASASIAVAAPWFFLDAAQRFYFWDYTKAKALVMIGRGLKLGDFAVPHGRQTTLTNFQMGMWLHDAVYHASYFDVFLPAVVAFIVALLVLLPGAAYLDQRRNRLAREGRPTRPNQPALVTRWRFNRKTRGTGFRIPLANRRNAIEWVLSLLMRRPYDAIRLKDHEGHILCQSDPAGGKSTIFKAVLDDAQREGWSAVIYDPHMEFVTRYYNEERGDIIINPLDARCPPWDLSDEIDYSDEGIAEAESLAQGASLYPGDSHSDRNWFFVYCSRLIFKQLQVHYRPSCHEMAYLMEHSDPLIDEIVRNTELQQMMAQNAENQRAGVVSHLSQIAYALRMMPRRQALGGRKPFTIREWSEDRKPWIFITSNQKTREGLRAIQSLLLDWTMMTLMAQGVREDLPPVLIAVDELPTLQRLPQMISVLSEGRKSLRVMFAIQGRSQLDSIYGPLSEVLMSIPLYKFFARTSESKASKDVSDMLGEVEIERVKESKSVHPNRQHRGENYTSERVMHRLVLPSEIASLPNLHGYLRYMDMILRYELPNPAGQPRGQLAPGFIPRKGVPVEKRHIPTLQEIAERRAAEKAAALRAKKAAAKAAEAERETEPKADADAEPETAMKGARDTSRQWEEIAPFD